MSRTAAALLALAVLLSIGHWVWARTVAHVDMQMLPACSRRRVHWLMAKSTDIQLTAAMLAVAAAWAQLEASPA